ncbi:hypothetical protein TWF696_002011 [Orbilia brochopaga]|uniref:F-box domain-containing protein n=1 Tax=Orbilia brochopaga TaxID=3140254 RepID=A0AAV9U826_9PEZI
MEPVPNPPLRFTTLPEELIERVCLQLYQGSQYAYVLESGAVSLSAVCRTSKLLKRIASPILYRQFCFGGKLSMSARFLRTICQEQDLAEAVQYLRIWRPDSNGLADEDIKFFTEVAEKLGLNLGALDVANPWHRRSYEIIVQLLIAQTSNLKGLEFRGISICEDRFELLRQLAAQDPRRVSLSKLRYFKYGADYSGHKIRLGYFDSLLELAPNIQSLCMPCYDPLTRSLANINQVTELSLRYGCISPEGLGTITHCCDAIHSFNMEAAGFEQVAIIEGKLTRHCIPPSRVITIIEPHKTWLRHLDLGSSGTWCQDHHERKKCEHKEQGFSVRAFSSLETFKINGRCVLYPEVNDHTNTFVNMLPRSIRRFHIFSAQKQAPANMITLATAIDVDFPDLDEILLNDHLCPVCQRGELKPVFEEADITVLSQLFKVAGVAFLRNAPRIDNHCRVIEEW